MSSTVVGALACQKNSFLKTFQTSVVSSFEYVPPASSRDKQNKNSKKKTDAPQQVKYAVELEDTILFPEGGGQPFDKGTISLPTSEVIEVQSVLRDKLTALHITDKPVAPGTQVTLNVDWKRRIDLMQQHTGQHLLSAVFDTYNMETLSWSMGDMINYIELPEKVSDDIVNEVNEKVNDLILDGIPISVSTPGQHGEELDTSHIPDDYDLSKGIIRVVKIGELDANPCCGTHLTSTSQIQAISLLHQTNVRGGHSRLHFLCGSRVYQYLRHQNQILKNVSGTQLSCQIDEVPEKVEVLNANYRKSQSRESALLKELATIEAAKVFETFSKTDKLVGFIYKPDNSPEFLTLAQKELTTLINSVTDSGVDLTGKHTLILLNGDYPSGTGGMVKVVGPKAEEIQAELKKRIANLKVGGKGTSFQGKIGKYEKREIESVLYYLENLQ